MTATTYAPYPRAIFSRFDLFTAATPDQILHTVEKDPLSIYTEIIAATHPYFMSLDEAKSDILYFLCEEANKRPVKFVQRYNSTYWRFFFVSFCKRSFGKTGRSNRLWKNNRQLEFHPDFYEHSERDIEDETILYQFLENCVELVEEIGEFSWWERKLWAVYRFDHEDWLKNEWVDDHGVEHPAPKKITYDYISKRTGVARTPIFKAVKKIDDFIKEKYEDNYGEAPKVNFQN